MANDVSYFNLENDSTEYSFNDADAEIKISQETARATAAEGANAAAISAETSRAQSVEGTLSNLTTTAKGNLVAAINEVDADVDIVEIAPFSSLSTGYTLRSNSSGVYKQGNHVFGNILVACSSALTTSSATIGTLTYKPVVAVNSFCGMSTGEWRAEKIGYVFLSSSNGALAVTDSTGGATFIKIHLDYVTN